MVIAGSWWVLVVAGSWWVLVIAGSWWVAQQLAQLRVGKSGLVCKSHAGSAVRDAGSRSGDRQATYVTAFLGVLGVGRG